MQSVQPNVQKLDVQFFDVVRNKMKAGCVRLSRREWWIKIRIWRGSVEAKEIITVMEVDRASGQ